VRHCALRSFIFGIFLQRFRRREATGSLRHPLHEETLTMSEEVRLARPQWRRLLSNNNPLYLVSAWSVLYGLSHAFRGEIGLQWLPLLTPLICGYALALAVASWLVVRISKDWNDARMILLVILLMFTALSTSYDNLCLKDPASGLKHLGFGFAFCCIVTEVLLKTLGIKLPLRYRLPLYLQLAVLFAFPAWLGKLSLDGRDPAMLMGVLLFSLCAAGALLTLWPAAASTRNWTSGTPWPWPFYPWSVFVFVGIASGIRSWMLSLSFSPAAGSDPAFLPYFLCPILIALLLLTLEIGLRERSPVTQRLALLALLGVAWLAFPGQRLSGAQRLTVDLLESRIAGPPMLVCGALSLVAVYALLRRAAGSEFAVLVSLSLLACVTPKTRDFNSLALPNEILLLALAAWQLIYGAKTRTMLRLTFGASATLILLGRQLDQDWLFEHQAFWTIQLCLLWFALLPLFCRDAFAKHLRNSGSFWLATAALVGPSLQQMIWYSAPPWIAATTVSTLVGIAILYWAVLRNRWYVLAALFAFVLAGAHWIRVALGLAGDLQVRQGLTWYALGWATLALALVLSLGKARLFHRFWAWLEGAASSIPPEQASNPPST
jgi:hypothetical protein